MIFTETEAGDPEITYKYERRYSDNFLSGEPAFIMPFNKYSFFLKSIIIKALKILRLMQSAQGLTPCTPMLIRLKIKCCK